jgi:opacity protein-like surface antigen
MSAAGYLTMIIPFLISLPDAWAGKEDQERMAKKACLTGDITKGVEILTDLFIDTNDPTYIYNQGRCFEQNRRYEDAIARFREYLIKAKNANAEERADTEKHIADCQSYLSKGETQKPGKPPSPPGQGPRQDVVGVALPLPSTNGLPPGAGQAGNSVPTFPGVAPDSAIPGGTKPAQQHRRTPGSSWLALAGGSGFAYHGRQAVDSRDKTADGTIAIPVAAGVVPASLLQFEPEIGIQVTDRFSLSVMVRYQFAPKEANGYKPGPGENEILTSAVAGFLRAQFAFLNLGNLQTYLTGGVGWGRSFLAVVSRDCNVKNDCPLDHSDTLHGGALGVMAGIGAIYHLSPNVGIFFDTKELLTFRTILGLTEFNLGVAVAVNLLD